MEQTIDLPGGQASGEGALWAARADLMSNLTVPLSSADFDVTAEGGRVVLSLTFDGWQLLATDEGLCRDVVSALRNAAALRLAGRA